MQHEQNSVMRENIKDAATMFHPGSTRVCVLLYRDRTEHGRGHLGPNRQHPNNNADKGWKERQHHENHAGDRTVWGVNVAFYGRGTFAKQT